jgi:hypothetical protein
MSFPNPPEKIVPFNSGTVAPHDIGRQFDEHRKSVSNVIDFLRTVVRDDGVVRNGSIGPEQLDPRLPEILAERAVAAMSALLANVIQTASQAQAALAEARIIQDRIEASRRDIAASADAMSRASEEVRMRLAAFNAEVETRSAAIAAPTGVLGPNVGGPFGVDDLGASATAQDYSQVSIEWAEHMPDTIPPNILAINAITGDHWSSRWWANRAAQIVAGIVPLPSGVVPMTEALSITATNTVSNLQHAPFGAVTLFYNGQAFSSFDPVPAFTVAGQTIAWISTIWTLLPGQSLVAQYFFAQ